MNLQSVIESGIILLVGVVLYLVFGRILRGVIHRAVHGQKHESSDPNDYNKREETLIGLFNTLWKFGWIAIVTALILKNLFPKVDLSPLFASAGIIGIAIGFGAQSIIKDFLSGIFIITDNQYRVGDVVEIDAASGTVEKIGVRSTILRDIEGNVHFIPNGTILHVINKTMGYSVARLNIFVSASTDIEKAIEVINNTGLKMSESAKWKEKVLEPPAFFNIGEITGTYINLIISGKTQPSEQWSVTAELRRRLLVDFEKADIKLAKQMLRMRQ
jgi:small conductance mechanosensitive channel